MNEIEKAIEILQDDIKRWSKNDIPKNTESLGLQAVLRHRKEKVSAYKLAISALEKQIPKKPIGISTTFERRVANCPSCNKFIREIENKKVCDCGQLLDWSGEDE